MWNQRIKNSREKYIGKKVRFNGKTYTVSWIDYLGLVYIDMPSGRNLTTAVYDIWDIENFLS